MSRPEYKKAVRARVIMLFSMSFQPFQGRYLRVYNQAKALAARGHDVTLVAWDRECRYPKEEIFEGIRIIRFWIRAGVGEGPRNGINVARFNWAVLRTLWSHPFDVLHCFNMDAIVAGLFAAKMRGKKAVLDLCEPEYYGFWDPRFGFLLRGIRWLEKTLAKRFDHLIVHNAYQVNKFRSYGISHISQVGSYPNRSMLARSVKAGKGSTITVGRLGTIYEDNGIEELIAAFQRLLDKSSKGPPAVKYKLFLAGRVYDSYRGTFESLVQSLGKNVEVLGAYRVDDLPRLYRNIDISIMTYRSKSWFGNVTPTKLFDSLVNGVPVVGNDIGEVGRILKENDCGVIVDERDPDSICQGIERLAMDDRLRKRMAENALKAARERYTWEAVEPVFLEAYQSLE